MHQRQLAVADYQFASKHFASNYYGHRSSTRLSLLTASAKKLDRSFSTYPDRPKSEVGWRLSLPRAMSDRKRGQQALWSLR